MFIRKRTHDAEVKLLNAQIATAWEENERLIDGTVTADAHLGTLRTEVDSLRHASFGADRTAAMYKRLYEAACRTLGKIAEQETPTANATVKRMARMARSELPVTHHDAGDGGSGFIKPTNGAAAQAAVS